MRKEVGFAVIAVSLILVLSVSLVSAGWFSDFFAKITGQVVDEGCEDVDENGYNTVGVCTDAAGTHDDYCDGGMVRDFYCGGGSWDGTSWIDQVCTEGGYTCPYGCGDGACLTEGEACSDGGDSDIYTKETCTDLIGDHYDYCDGGVIRVYSCRSGECVTGGYTCPYGCADGACLTQETGDCTDEGSDRNVKEICTDSLGEHEDYCDAGHIKQYYCSGGECTAGGYSCEFGCVDGACLTEEAGTCTDNSGDIYTKGTCTDTIGENEDYCSGGTLREYRCSLGECVTGGYVCLYGCGEGACLSRPGCTPLTCLDIGKECGSFSNGCGIYINCGSCDTGYFCSSGTCLTFESNQSTQSSSSTETGVVLSCADSDGGLEYNIKGTAQGHSDTTQESISDCCKSPPAEGECSVSGTHLYEAVCQQGSPNGLIYLCSNGCFDGACIIEGEDTEDLVVINPTRRFMEIPDDDGTPEVYICLGCELDGKCYSLGIRKAGEYCSEDLVFVEQRADEEFCNNNFECNDNVCTEYTCVNQNIFERVVNWFTGLFGGRKESFLAEAEAIAKETQENVGFSQCNPDDSVTYSNLERHMFTESSGIISVRERCEALEEWIDKTIFSDYARDCMANLYTEYCTNPDIWASVEAGMITQEIYESLSETERGELTTQETKSDCNNEDRFYIIAREGFYSHLNRGEDVSNVCTRYDDILDSSGIWTAHAKACVALLYTNYCSYPEIWALAQEAGILPVSGGTGSGDEDDVVSTSDCPDSTYGNEIRGLRGNFMGTFGSGGKATATQCKGLSDAIGCKSCWTKKGRACFARLFTEFCGDPEIWVVMEADMVLASQEESEQEEGVVSTSDCPEDFYLSSQLRAGILSGMTGGKVSVVQCTALSNSIDGQSYSMKGRACLARAFTEFCDNPELWIGGDTS